jgi:hypothetical protein
LETASLLSKRGAPRSNCGDDQGCCSFVRIVSFYKILIIESLKPYMAITSQRGKRRLIRKLGFVIVVLAARAYERQDDEQVTEKRANFQKYEPENR